MTQANLTFLALALLLALPTPARADADADIVAGRAALDRGDAAAAISALERARGEAPQRADVCWHLGRAYEREGRASDAIAFYEAAARLDGGRFSGISGGSGIAASAKADAARLRESWLKAELDDARESLAARRFARAREAYERAFDMASEADAATRGRAREGAARAAALEVAATAVKDRPQGVTVAVLPLLGAAPGSPHGDVAQVIEEALVTALRAAGATVVGPALKARAAVVVHGWTGQRFVLRADDQAAGGVALARLTLRALLDAKEGAAQALAPDPVTLELSITAERDVYRASESTGGPRALVQTQSVPVAEGAVLRSGDRFRIRARASRDAHVYAFIFDAQGRATLLYPGVERLFPDLAAAGVRTANPTSGKKDLLIPPDPPKGRPYWFVLDESTGTETFYVAASLAPLEDVEALVSEIEAAGEPGREAARRLAAALARRGASTRVEEGQGGHIDLIRGRGAAVRTISVEHR